MKLRAKPLLGAFCLCCLPIAPALLAQDAPADPSAQQAGQTQTQQENNPGSSTVAPVAPSDSTVSPNPATTVAPVTNGTAPESGANPASAQPANGAGDTANTAALNLLTNRIGPNYLIGPEDVLTVDVFDVPELSKL